jgi:Domain of unknown function (DUF2017)
MARFGPKIKRTRRGDFDIDIPRDERSLLRTVVPQLRELLDGDLDDPALRRLFPTAYADDPERDREYQQLVRDDLADRRRAAVDTMIASIDAKRVDEEQLLSWMSAVNDMRLVLGTRLDVSEESELVPEADDPEAGMMALYGYLGLLLETMILAIER